MIGLWLDGCPPRPLGEEFSGNDNSKCRRQSAEKETGSGEAEFLSGMIESSRKMSPQNSCSSRTSGKSPLLGTSWLEPRAHNAFPEVFPDKFGPVKYLPAQGGAWFVCAKPYDEEVCGFQRREVEACAGELTRGLLQF